MLLTSGYFVEGLGHCQVLFGNPSQKHILLRPQLLQTVVATRSMDAVMLTRSGFAGKPAVKKQLKKQMCQHKHSGEIPGNLRRCYDNRAADVFGQNLFVNFCVSGRVSGACAAKRSQLPP